MQSYPYRRPIMSEADSDGASVPPFYWFHQGSFFSATKNDLNSFQATNMSPNRALDAIPIRSVAPMDIPEENTDFGTKPTKDKKKKPSAEDSNRNVSKVLTPKKPRKKSSPSKKAKGQTKPEKIERKNLNLIFDRSNFDFSGTPVPFCSCTGVARACYKWGTGGWQSSCCNSNISQYPLPMSPSRPGARMAGRKMSNGAYKKLMHRLMADGHDLSQPVDLKDHWAKHGTNKFVTIK